MYRLALGTICCALMVSLATAEPLWLKAGGEQPPRIYLFWQSGWDPITRPDEHIRMVADCPPDLFQYSRLVGISRGIAHESMCPAPGEHEIHWSHETDGGPDETGAYTPQWYTTEQYQALLDQGREDVAWVMQNTGALGLAPYICAKKIQGEHEKRLRFWAFYDHWDQYEQWYGPKPEDDPWDWVMFRIDYHAKSLWAFYKPQPDGSNIYSACPNSPFSKYLADFTRASASTGLRGVFVDNPSSNCVCKYCQAVWPEYLAERFTPAEFERYFGLERYSDADIEEPRFEIERMRFWGWSIARHLARIKAAGEDVVGAGNFWVCPNGGPLAFEPSNGGGDLTSWAEAGASQLISRECNRMTEGVERRRLTDRLYFNAADDLILGHKLLRGCTSSQMWSAPLRSHVFLGNDPKYYLMAAAEALAFDGILVDSGPPWFATEARKPFHAFYRPLEEQLRSGPSVAEVGVLTFTNELLYDPADSVREVRLVTDWLSEARVLWDAVPDDNFTNRDLSGYSVVLAPNVRMLDDSEVAHLLDYARAGGRLIVSGEFGTHYRCGVTRPDPPSGMPVGEPDATGCAQVAFGDGQILLTPRLADIDLRVPYTGSDVLCEYPARGLIRDTNREAFLAAFNRVAGEGLSALLAPGPRNLRVAARWFRDGDAATMTVHLANYDLSVHSARVKYYHIPRSPGDLTPAENVRLAVPVPAGWQATGVRWAQMPDPALQDVDCEVLRDGIAFTVPRVDSYVLAVVDLVPGTAQARSSLHDYRGPATSAEGAMPAVEVTGGVQPIIYAADAPEGGLPGLEQVLHVAPGLPVVVDGVAGQELQILMDRPGQERPDPVIWQPMRAFDAAGEGDKGDVRWLRFWVVAPSGSVAASGAVPADQPTLIRLAAAESGLYALLTEGGPGSIAVSTTSRALMSRAQHFEAEQPNERLYFQVPEGATSFKINTWGMDSTMHFTILDADGQHRFERDDFNFMTVEDEIAVPQGQSGRIWSMTFATELAPERRAARRTMVELQPPLQGFVSPGPARLALFD